MMEEINNSGVQGQLPSNRSETKGDLSVTAVRERNIRDALDYMKVLQDLTITTGQMQHTKIESDAGGAQPAMLDEHLLMSMKDIELKNILDKRFNDLNAAEKVVLTLHLINQQLTNIESIV